MREFSDTEREILRKVQGTLPDSATPFADIAGEVGVEEEELLDLLRSMKDEGSIRRFGATLRHQKAGYGFNAMVAWLIEGEEENTRVGELMAEEQAVSHCYWRPGTEEWPYTLYTMVHARSKEDCLETVKDLAEKSGGKEYQILFSLKELKKTSMAYF